MFDLILTCLFYFLRDTDVVMSGRDIERNYETEREVKTRRKREQEEWARHVSWVYLSDTRSVYQLSL